MAASALLPPPPMDDDGAAPPASATPVATPAPTPEPTLEPPAPRWRRPPVRVTSEFDGERRLFSHRFSCRVLDGLAKLRLHVSHGAGFGGGVSWPEVGLISRNFSVVVDTASRGAVLRGAADLASSLRLRASHNTKEQQGEVAVTANLGDSPCKIELSSLVPPDGLPRATFLFPNGEVSVKEKKLDEGDRILSLSGLAKSHVLNGVCKVVYSDNVMNIKYRYKDEEISFIPSISLPSNSLSLAFKRQLTTSDKISYWYDFATNYWGAVYKHKADKHLKWKAGYESDNRLGWASLWVGDASASTKEVPFKTKVRFTLKVPRDNIQNSVVLFYVKKRWTDTPCTSSKSR